MVAPTEGDLANQKESVTKTNQELTIYVDSIKVIVPPEEKERPRVDENDRTIAPMTFVFEAAGWDDEWIRPENNGGISKAIYTYPSKTDWEWKIEINHNDQNGIFYKKDSTGKITKYNIPFSEPPFVEYGRTVCELAPLFDFLSKYIGAYTVTWGYGSNSVWIDSQAVKNKPVLDEKSNSASNVDEIQDLQSLLNQNGFKPQLKISGVFDFTTKWALTAFQTIVGLEPTGVCNAATWAALLRHKGTLGTDTWPKTGKVITMSGSYVRKDSSIADTNILSTVLFKGTVQVYSKGIGGWVPVIVNVKGIDLKGFMESKDLSF
jgi:hypothetical protein